MREKLLILKKIGINIFIICCLWVTLSINFGIRIPEYNGDSPVIREARWQVDRLDWGLRYLGWSSMINTYWRMFSPVDRFNWLPHYYGLFADGTLKRLPETYHVSERNFLQRNLTDFREAKYQLNIYYNQPFEDFNMAYMCRKYTTDANPMVRVYLKIQTQYIKAPAEGFRTGEYWMPDKSTMLTNTFDCK